MLLVRGPHLEALVSTELPLLGRIHCDESQDAVKSAQTLPTSKAFRSPRESPGLPQGTFKNCVSVKLLRAS